MKPKHQSDSYEEAYQNMLKNVSSVGGIPKRYLEGKRKFRYRKINRFIKTLIEARDYKFLWIWRFLFTWGWNGKKNTFCISFYKPDRETCIWRIGDY